jgi:hypothetical protein
MSNDLHPRLIRADLEEGKNELGYILRKFTD